MNWKAEAQAVIKDISNCVTTARLSSQCATSSGSSSSEEEAAYINIETKEGIKITVRLDTSGFSVVGRDHFDDKSLESRSNQKYETIYALLNNLSPSYTLTFAQNLTDKLSKLANSTGSDGNHSSDLNNKRNGK